VVRGRRRALHRRVAAPRARARVHAPGAAHHPRRAHQRRWTRGPSPTGSSRFRALAARRTAMIVTHRLHPPRCRPT
jgi:hypothetical protein